MAARANPASYDALTVFSKQMFQLFRMNEGLGYGRAALQQVYRDNLKVVIPFAVRSLPVTWTGVWNVTSCSLGYKNFYLHFVPAVTHRLLPRTTATFRRARNFSVRCLKIPRRWFGQLAHRLITRVVTEALKSTGGKQGAETYGRIGKSLDEIARKTFDSQVNVPEGSSRVRHPLYLHNPHCLKVGNNFSAGPGLRIEAWDSYAGDAFLPEIVIGDGVALNWNVHLGAIDRIEIHDNVLIGSNVVITDHAHGNLTAADCDQPPCLRRLSTKGKVVIEENVWIGENVSILANVTIGKGAVIGANSVVTKNIPAYAVAAGAPAKVIRQLR